MAKEKTKRKRRNIQDLKPQMLYTLIQWIVQIFSQFNEYGYKGNH